MVIARLGQSGGPARKRAVPLLALALGLAAPPALAAQAQPAVPARPQAAPQIDVLLASKLVWTTMAAVDHANRTGNYSVLRDLGSPSFQAANNAATLATVFAAIRNSRVDLSNSLLLAPQFEIVPQITRDGMLRMRGVFALRPTGAAFDLLFQNVGNEWRLFGVAIIPYQMGTTQPAPGRR